MNLKGISLTSCIGETILSFAFIRDVDQLIKESLDSFHIFVGSL